MPYTNLESRTDVQATIPEKVSNDILTSLTYDSAAMTLFRHITMGTNQTRMPVLSALPTAYFVNGDTGLKQTTELAWANKYLNAEELAVIVPIPENVLDDMTLDIWAEAQPLLVAAVARVLDAAIFFGVNKPASWPAAIVTDAVATGQTVNRGTNNTAAGGIAGDVEDTIAKVEASGYMPTGFVTNRTYKSYFRKARDTQGQRLLDFGSPRPGALPNPGNVGDTFDMIEGLPVVYAMAGLWPSGSGSAELFTGDFTQGLLGVRKDMTWKILDQAVIQDNTGAIVYNLAQQDMVAIRLTCRFAFQVANTITWQQPVAASRYPFSVLRAP